MLPVPIPPKKRSDNAEKQPGVAPFAVVWVTPYLFLVPCMIAVGVVRIVVPWAKDDCEEYLKGLSGLFKESLAAAVSYRAAGTSRHRCNASTRVRTRPNEATRPGGKPGVARSRRRSRTRR